MAMGQNSMQQRVRDFAYRVGLPRFWRWWMAELAPLVPATSRGAIRRRLTRPVIEFGDGQAVFLRAQVADGRVARDSTGPSLREVFSSLPEEHATRASARRNDDTATAPTASND